MLCSDGVSSEIPQHRILDLIAEKSSAQAMADRIVEEALDLGGRDNITAIVVDVKAIDTPTETRFDEATAPGLISVNEATQPRPVVLSGGVPAHDS